MLPIEPKEDNVTSSRGRVYAKEINGIHNELKNVIGVQYPLIEADNQQLLKAIEIISKSGYYKDYSLDTNTVNLKRDLIADRVEEYVSGSVYYFSVTQEKVDDFKISINDLPIKSVVNHLGEIVRGVDLVVGDLMVAIYDGVKFYVYSLSGLTYEMRQSIEFVHNDYVRNDGNLGDISDPVEALTNLGGASKAFVDSLSAWKTEVLAGNEDLLLKSNNLSDLTNVVNARTSLSVYSIDQVDNFITTLNTSIDGKLSKNNNLSDLENMEESRTNLSVYSTVEINNMNTGLQTSLYELDNNKLSKSNNLSELTDMTSARNSLNVYSKQQIDILNEDMNNAILGLQQSTNDFVIYKY